MAPVGHLALHRPSPLHSTGLTTAFLPRGVSWNYAVSNSTAQPISYNLETELVTTNDIAVAVVVVLITGTIWSFARHSRQRGWLN